MEPLAVTIVLLAVGAGLVAGYLVGVARYGRQHLAAQTRASGLEASLAEARAQAAALTQQLDQTRSRLEQEQSDRIMAQTQLADALERLKAEKLLLEEARSRLSDAFKATAGDTLQAATSSFLDLARQTLEKLIAQAKGDMETRQQAIQGMVTPIADALRQFEQHVRSLENDRRQAYAGLLEQIKVLTSAHQDLQNTTGSLVTALRHPTVVGSWGQVALERVVELAGMTEHCDFTVQVCVASEHGRLRPDMVIHLPGGRQIVVDAKATFEAYHQALSATSEQQRAQALARHAEQVRAHMLSLAGKQYWEQFDQAPEFVVMFIPGESFFSAAVSTDARLLEDAMTRCVILATPTTLLALLRAVAYGWRQDQVARNAQQIWDLGRQVYDRLKVVAEHLSEIGRGLERANAAYNNAVGSIESRLLPAARRLKDLGAGGNGEVPAIEPVQTCPRQVASPELGRPGQGGVGCDV